MSLVGSVYLDVRLLARLVGDVLLLDSRSVLGFETIIIAWASMASVVFGNGQCLSGHVYLVELCSMLRSELDSRPIVP